MVHSIFSIIAVFVFAFPKPALLPDTRPGHALGIDVSVHSGSIDWEKFDHDRFAFVYLKASEGIDLEDGAFQRHWQELGRLNIPRGAYHFFVTEDDPIEQAHFFIKTVGKSCGEMPPVVDIETLGHGSSGDISRNLRIWIDEVKLVYGMEPVIYTSPKFWSSHVSGDFSRCHLWVAEYGVPTPLLPSGWSRWALWQFRENAPLAWVEKGADFSYFHQDLVPRFLNKQSPKIR